MSPSNRKHKLECSSESKVLKKQKLIDYEEMDFGKISTVIFNWRISGICYFSSDLHKFNKDVYYEFVDSEHNRIRCHVPLEFIKDNDIKVGFFYSISKFYIQICNQDWNSCNHRYEIILHKNSEVIVKGETSLEYKTIITYVSLKDLRSLDRRRPINLKCKVSQIYDISYTTTGVKKQVVIVTDESGLKIPLVFWKDCINDICFKESDDIYIYNSRITMYNNELHLQAGLKTVVRKV